jgi:dTDP-4-dehydrorhamnose 3,5-epimerase
MEALDLMMNGLVLFQPKVYPDKRGYFLESFNDQEFRRNGIFTPFRIECQSSSIYGTLRGLHAQKENPQAKLVRVVHGEIYDVQVDIRLESKTYLKWSNVRLSAENQLQIYIPQGFLHGFLVLSDSAVVVYKSTEYYDPKDEMSVRWNDPDINIGWPFVPRILSDKDATSKFWKEQK